MEPSKTNNKRACKRCLLRDMVGEDYADHIRIYLSGIEEERRTPKEKYEERLKACTECEFLRDGICAKCGCFVEYRASIVMNLCPIRNRRW